MSLSILQLEIVNVKRSCQKSRIEFFVGVIYLLEQEATDVINFFLEFRSAIYTSTTTTTITSNWIITYSA